MKLRILGVTIAFLSAITLLVLDAATRSASATVPGTNTLISAKTDGTAASGDNYSYGNTISSDGRYMLFKSGSRYVVSGDTNNTNDIFVRDTKSGISTRVSVSTSGQEANGPSGFGVISGSGRYAIFTSGATNLIDGQTSPANQLYIRDLVTNTTDLALKYGTGNTVVVNNVIPYAVSSDGRFILFESDATNIDTSFNNGGYNYFLLDRSNNSYKVVNAKYDGTVPKNLIQNSNASMSCDGSLIVFNVSPSLTTAPTNHVDTYLLDLRSGRTLTNLTYSLGNDGATFAPQISCNGDYITFYSATSQITGVVSPYCRAYVYNRINSTFALAEQSTSGNIGNSGDNWMCGSLMNAYPSDNGLVVFYSNATNLTPDTVSPNSKRVYVRNTVDGTTELLSKTSAGVPVEGFYSMISSNGKVAVYTSSTDSVSSATDTNGQNDVYSSLTGY